MPTSSKDTKEKQPKFEEALAALEEIVSGLEGGDKPLDAAVAGFEKGMALANQCQKTLEDAERRIEKILTDAEGNAIGTTPLKEDF